MSEQTTAPADEKACKLSGKYCPDCGQKTRLVLIEGIERKKCVKMSEKKGCGYIDWEPPVFVAVAIVPGKRTDKRTIVLVQRANKKWCMPAGFLNTGEHPSAASVRETGEEGGMTITAGELPVRILTPPGRNQNLIFYYADSSDGVIKHGSDALDAQEFAADELPEIAFPLHRVVIDQYFAGAFDKK